MAAHQPAAEEVENLVHNDIEVCKDVLTHLKENGHPICGSDNAGNEFDSVEDMWTLLGILPPTPTDATTAGDDADAADVDTDANANAIEAASVAASVAAVEEEESGKHKDDVDDNNSSSSTESWYWYEHSGDYWEDEENGVVATVDGMLGGFASISDVDLVGSRVFLEEVVRIRNQSEDLLALERCCDCGAGIGRITRDLLLPLGFTSCHLVDASARMLEAAPDYVNSSSSSSSSGGGDDAAVVAAAGTTTHRCRYVHTGLQDYAPAPDSFDVVWIQWVIGYLTDGDCVRFLRRCGQSLRKGGVVCIKDNTSGTAEAFQLDRNDSSITRSLPYLQSLAAQANLRLVHLKMQTDFPEEIYPVPMLAYEYNDINDTA